MTTRICSTLVFLFFAMFAHAQTVVDVIVNSDDHTTLEAAVIAADLDGALSGPGPFTVFAPTDDAFDLLPPGTVTTLLDDPTGDLARILLYHVLGAEVMSTDLTDGQVATTLLGQNIDISLNMNGIFINGALVTVADIPATNGVVHVLNAVILPPAETVVDVVVNSDVHTTLETAVIAAELDDDLSGDGPFTLFAPTDAAFDVIDPDVLADLLADPTGELANILLYHAVSAEVLSSDLTDGQVATTLLGDDITVTIDANGVFINDAQVTVADIRTFNGVVHVIDAVLLPEPPSATEFITESEDHTTLEAALIAAELDGVLAGDGPFTIFAPTDDAFDLLPAGTVTTLLDDPTGDLARILLYHVLGAEVMSADLTDGQVATTLLGQNIDVTVDMNGVFINGVQVSVADVPVSNGVIHVLDAVLLPPAETVVDVVVNSDVHTTLETAVIAAELDDDLSGDGPFTLFAPTDDAFALIDSDVLTALLDDPTGDLADILLYHAVSGEVLAGDLTDGMMATTLLGDDILVTINADGVFINDAEVTVTDIRTYNGVVHVLDAVLLPEPPTVVEIIVESEDHTTLEAAVIAAELDGALSGDGPFTVFAPTDDAFDLLPTGTVTTLLDDPTGDLARILLYHVLGAEVMSTDLTNGQIATTLLGQNIEVTVDMNGVSINGVQVSVADIPASNGVVHVLDAVLLPPARTVVDVVVNSDVHTTLETAVIAAELDDDLSGDGPFTLFAPTDDAFALIDSDVLTGLLADPTGDLAKILLYHVVPGEVLSTDLTNGMMATTLFDNQDVEVTINSDGVFINDAEVIISDIRTYNGVVHVIDAVLMPTITSSIANLTEADIMAYPNPVENMLNVTLPAEMSETEVTMDLVDATGKTLKSWSVNGTAVEAELSEIPSGFYFLSLTSDTHFAKLKVVKK